MNAQEQTLQTTYLDHCRQALEQARAENTIPQICVSLADLGLALFQEKQFEEGMARFEEATALAEKQQDIYLHVQCLGIKVLAFQEIDRLHDAFQVAQDIFQLGEAHNNHQLMCDALVSQGQILLDAGEPIIATEKLSHARSLAETLNDLPRKMNVLGALGNLNLSIVALEQAAAYFEKASNLARDLGDKPSEAGYLNNLGVLIAKAGSYANATDTFERVLFLARELSDSIVERNALQYLIKAKTELGQLDKTLDDYIRHASKLAQHIQSPDDRRTYEDDLTKTLLNARHYKAAVDVLVAALKNMPSQTDKAVKLELLTTLGDVYYELQELDAAIQAYEQALPLPRQLANQTTEARILGRLGSIYAEKGDLERANTYTNGALKLAKQSKDDHITGELLCVLALNYRDLGQMSNAINYCKGAILAFQTIEAKPMIEQAQNLLSELQTTIPLNSPDV